jgi:hypothetical protein
MFSLWKIMGFLLKKLHDFENSVNMELILCIFEQLSGLKINFHNSEIFVLEKLKSVRRTTKKYLVV